MTHQPDRVSYSYGFTLPGPEQYSSFRVDVRHDTAIRDGETAEQAIERARDFVHAEVAKELPEAPARGAKIDDELFDPSNPVHRRLAAAVFDAEGVASDKAREYKLNRLLKGERVGDIGRLVRDDQEAFRGGRQQAEKKTGWGGFATRQRHGGGR